MTEAGGLSLEWSRVAAASLLLAGCPESGGPTRAEFDSLALQVSQLEDSLAERDAALADRDARIAELEAKTAPIEVEDTEMRLVGVNLSIQNGEGETLSSPNGLGNLILGYDEGEAADKRGSHNIVVGTGHAYTGVASIVSGRNNVVVAESVVLASYTSSAGDGSLVLGGDNNDSGPFSVVIGGHINDGSAPGSVIVGGTQNKTLGEQTAMSTGFSPPRMALSHTSQPLAASWVANRFHVKSGLGVFRSPSASRMAPPGSR